MVPLKIPPEEALLLDPAMDHPSNLVFVQALFDVVELGSLCEQGSSAYRPIMDVS